MKKVNTVTKPMPTTKVGSGAVKGPEDHLVKTIPNSNNPSAEEKLIGMPDADPKASENLVRLPEVESNHTEVTVPLPIDGSQSASTRVEKMEKELTPFAHTDKLNIPKGEGLNYPESKVERIDESSHRYKISDSPTTPNSTNTPTYSRDVIDLPDSAERTSSTRIVDLMKSVDRSAHPGIVDLPEGGSLDRNLEGPKIPNSGEKKSTDRIEGMPEGRGRLPRVGVIDLPTSYNKPYSHQYRRLVPMTHAPKSSSQDKVAMPDYGGAYSTHPVKKLPSDSMF